MRLGLLACGLAAAFAAAGAHGQATDPAAIQPAATPAPQPCSLVPAGTPVEVELTELVTSRRATSGDKYKLKLAADLTIDGRLVMAAGVAGRGEVIDAAPAGLAGRPGKLVLAARSLDAGAVHLPLHSFRLSGSGRDDSKATMVMMNTPYVGILAIFVHGGNIDYPPGTRAIAKVAADTFIAAPDSPPASSPPAAYPAAQPQDKKP